MNTAKQMLLINQADWKLQSFIAARKVIVPQKGWINTIRGALKMSLSHLGKRLKISPQSVKELEEREANGTITIYTLREAGKVLIMKLIYGFVPMDKSIEKMIAKRALEVARDLVMRTSQNMKLEDQATSRAQVRRLIEQKALEIKMKMSKQLWD
jgi:predicted DNA-binding mobile mystery protein A